MKPEVFHRKAKTQFTLVAFKYTYASSIGYVWCREVEDVAKQVVRFLSDPNSADVISIRKVYVTEEEAAKLEKQASALNTKESDKNEHLD